MELSKEYAFIGEKVSAYSDRSLRQFFLGISSKTWQNTLCLPSYLLGEDEAQKSLSSSPSVSPQGGGLPELSLSPLLPPLCILSLSPRLHTPFVKVTPPFLTYIDSYVLCYSYN